MLGCGARGNRVVSVLNLHLFFLLNYSYYFFHFVLAGIVIHLLKNNHRTALLVTVNAKMNVRS